jgi:hypothetical protein
MSVREGNMVFVFGLRLLSCIGCQVICLALACFVCVHMHFNSHYGTIESYCDQWGILSLHHTIWRI